MRRLPTIVAADPQGRDPPPDSVYRSPRPWRIDPYRRGLTRLLPRGSTRPHASLPTSLRPPAARPLAGRPYEPDRGAERPTCAAWGCGPGGTEMEGRPRGRGDEKYVVCNADESEPGTFKDRELLLRTPHLVIEGLILAGLLVRRRGYIYIRHEYEEPIEACRGASRPTRPRGLRTNVLGTGRRSPSRSSSAPAATSAASRVP